MPLDYDEIIVPEGVKVPATPDQINQIGNYLKNQTTDDVPEGTTNYFMTSDEKNNLSNQSGVNTGDETLNTIKAKLVSTDNLPEGSTNEYYTNARSEAVARSIVVNDLVTGGTDSPLSAEQGKVLHSVRKVSDSRDSTAYNMLFSINSDGYLVATFSSI